MALHDPVLHQFISYLAEKKAEQEANPDQHVEIRLPRTYIAKVRAAFRENILDGERHLHILSHLLASKLLDGFFDLNSNVIGVLQGDAEHRPFLIRERIAQDKLFTVMDLDLGNQMLDNFRYRKDNEWVSLQLSANFVEYIPITAPTTGVNRLTSRVKAEEELWNKVADELFQLDQLVSRDKHLRRYSKYVKDIFGIKIVCSDDVTCIEVHNKLREMLIEKEACDLLSTLHPSSVTKALMCDRHLDFLETKDYLTCAPSEMKKTGWKALKSVVRWQSRLFEIQVQPLGNYYLELDHMSGPSHSSFKILRDTMRDEVAKQVPLYGFYRDLLKMMFTNSDVSFESRNASVIIEDC